MKTSATTLRLVSIVCVVLYFTPALGAQSQGRTADSALPTKSLETYLEAYHRISPFSGFQAVIADATGPLWAKAYGVTAPGGKTPMTIDTPSAIGSITKSFTAVAIMLLAERGDIDLDAPVTRYLPWFRTADKHNSDRITVRMLLANSSGIASADRFLMDADESDGAMERSVRDLARTTTVREPGTSFEYANENWNVLGVIIEAVSGLPYRSFMEKEIFAPLGLTRTTTDPARYEELGVLYGQYWGPNGAYPAARRVVAMSYACGSELRSTATDMGKYLAFYLSGGRAPNGFRLLSETSIAAMTTGVNYVVGKAVDLGGNGVDDRYGYGLILSEIDGRLIVNHGGNRGDMSAFMAWDPATGLGVALLFPADSADSYRFPLHEKIANDLLHLAAGEALTDYGIVTRPDPARREETIDLSADISDALVGDYGDKGGQKARVYEEGGRVLAEIDGGLVQDRVLIQARVDDRFLAENLHGAVTGFFLRGADGRAVSISFEGNTFYRLQAEDAVRRSGPPDGVFSFASPSAAFSFVSPGGLEWTWDGMNGQATSAAGVAYSIRRLDPAAAALACDAAATADWLADSFGAAVWLENIEMADEGRLRFIAMDRRGFRVAVEAPAEKISLAIGTGARRIMESLDVGDAP